MEANAFYASGIETITFEEGSTMTYIRDNAFQDCKNLKSFHVPPGLTDLSNRAFVNCNLETVSVSPYNSRFTSRDLVSPYEEAEVNAILESRWDDERHYLVFAGSNQTYIDSNYSRIREVGDWAFSGRTGIRELDVSGIEELGASAFEGCINLTNLNFASLNLWVDQTRFLNTFRRCTGLTSITLNGDIVHNLLDGVPNLKTVTCTAATTVIGDFAFNGNYSLTNINLGELYYLNTIGAFSFSGCSNLAIVNIPSSCTEIRAGAFYATGISQIKVSAENYVYTDSSNGVSGAIIRRYASESEPYPLIVQAGKNTNVVDNSSYFLIGNYAFAGFNYNAGTTLKIPRNTLSIGDYAFTNSTNCSVAIPETVENMGKKVFSGWKENQTITIPASRVRNVTGDFKIAVWNNRTWALTPMYNASMENVTYYLSQDCGSPLAHIVIA